ncbi:MAG: sigma-70 family RNA polymerase sigma factor [Prevotella sp.]|nr:sigma-70 family RNA polymerase sigma factor [Prevotella sp.]MDY5666628.1 sigma-70 family RNA polymerase sigma factor [Alloprevotella sp.]
MAATYNTELLQNPKTRMMAFAEMVKDLTPQLYAHIRRIVQYHDDADDVLQNTFMKAWQALDNFRGDCQISTWLYRIALNESLSLLQRTHTDERLSDEVNEGCARSLESDAYFDGDDLELKLQKAIASLPDKQRIVFNLRYFDEMKYSEMSSLLSTSEGALKASYHLAVKKIEQYFVEND